MDRGVEQIPSGLEPASKKRRLLAVYIDFLIYESIYRPIACLGLVGGFLDKSYVKYGFFALTFALSWFLKKATPGLLILGINYTQKWEHDQVAVVDSSQLKNERWWIMLLGVLFILEGSKNLVRWTQGLPPQPFFGDFSSEWMLFLFKSVVGLLSILAGVMLLKKNERGAMLGVVLGVIQLVPMLLFQKNFVEWAERATIARRELQGLPIRDGELGFMKKYVVMGMPSMVIVAILFLLLAYFKLRKENFIDRSK